MRSMKKTGVVRLMVAVLDANCIPDDADTVVDDCLYEIFFKVDQVVNEGGETEDIDVDNDLDPNNKKKGADHEMEDMDNNLSGSGSSGS